MTLNPLTTVRNALVIPAALLVACGGTDDRDADPELPGMGEPGPDLTGYHTQGYHTQGYHTQGYATQGYNEGSDPIIKAFLLSSLVEGGSTVDKAYLAGGAIEIDASITTYNTSSLGACSYTGYGPWRGCGWRTSGVGTCTPYTTVWLGSGPGGSCGPCTGDTMVRVCADDHACEKGGAYYLNDNDDACGTLCSRVSFTCPASGTYNVMTASYASSASSKIAFTSSSGAYPVYNQHLAGADLAGGLIKAEHTDGSIHQYMIAAAAPEPGYPASTFRYDVQAQTPNPPFWASICDPSDPPGPNGAVVVAGWWTSTGAHVDDPDLDRVTFACHQGVVDKCLAWGYAPWLYSATSAGPWLSLAEAHQACTRMARADYCGTGISHTYVGTPIIVYDNYLPQIQAKEPAALPFEAGWTADGAACLSHLRWMDAPPEVFTCPHLTDAQAPDGKKTCPQTEMGAPYLDPFVVHLFDQSDAHFL